MEQTKDLKTAPFIDTWQIWEESGIVPEPAWLLAVECLHRHAMKEPEADLHPAALFGMYDIVQMAASLPGFRVRDRDRMLTYARLCGIDVSGCSNHDIALRITGIILSDYGVQLSDIHDLIPPVPIEEGQKFLRSSGRYTIPSERTTNPSGITS